MNKKTIFYFLLLLSVAFSLKLFHATSSLENLAFILKPVSFLVSVFQNEPEIFLSQEGYYFEHTGIIIDKSCAGMNFLIIVWCTLGTLCVSETMSLRRMAMHFIFLFCTAYVLTVIANTSRIVCIIQTIPLRDTFSFLSTSWFHEALGTTVYVSMLVIASTTTQYLNIKNKLRYVKLS